MADATRRTDVRVDEDGVRLIRTSGVRPSVWLVAVGLAILIVFLLVRAQRPAADSDPTAAGSTKSAPLAAAPPLAPPPAFKPVRRSEPQRPPAPAEDPPAEPPAPAVDDRAESADDEAVPEDSSETDPEELSGIALFPPPGTDPPKSGLIVPDDFELPPGYVRHYQTTDDGKELPAILMFHPDYEWVDERGEAIDVPEDKVVPPELAPAGLPLRTLEVPELHIPMVEEPRDGEVAD